MTLESTNPAGRLYNLLHAANEVGRKNTDAPMYKVWAEVFGTQGQFETIDRINQVMQLPREIQKAVEETELPPDRVIPFMLELENLLVKRNFDLAWSNFVRLSHPHIMNGLSTCSLLLSAATKADFSDAHVKDLHEKIRTLFDEAVRADIDDLKRFLLEQLKNIEAAIQDYWISGVKALREGVNEAVGASAARRGLWDKMREAKVGKKFVQILTVYNALTVSVERTASLKDLFLPEPTPLLELIEREVPQLPYSSLEMIAEIIAAAEEDPSDP